jgi:hypothetical protein
MKPLMVSSIVGSIDGLIDKASRYTLPRLYEGHTNKNDSSTITFFWLIYSKSDCTVEISNSSSIKDIIVVLSEGDIKYQFLAILLT